MKDRSFADAEKLKELQKLALDQKAPAGNDWPQWRGPGRDGIASAAGLLTTWPAEGPKKLWEHETGKSYSSFAVAQSPPADSAAATNSLRLISIRFSRPPSVQDRNAVRTLFQFLHRIRSGAA